MLKAIEAKLNTMKIETVYKEDGTHFKWRGFIPEGVGIVAPFANCLASEKNKAKWLKQCGVNPSEVDTKTEVPQDGDKALQYLEVFETMTKQEIAEYAEGIKGIPFSYKGKNKEKLISEVLRDVYGISYP